MKKLLLNSILLLCALVVGSMNGWAADKLYSSCLFGGTHGTSNSYASTWTATNGTFSWSVTNGNTNGSNWAYAKFGRKDVTSVGTVTTSTAYPMAINKVKVNISAITADKINSIKLYTKTSSGSWTEAGSFTKGTGEKTVELASPAENLLYKVEFDCASGNSNGLVSVTKIDYYVEDVPITAISLPSTASVGVGGTTTLTPTITPSNATGTVDWESDNESVASVDDGVVTGVAAGTAHITAKSHDDGSIYAECTVTVTAPIAVTGVSLNKTSLPLYFGESETLVATIAPTNATNTGLTWESDNTSVATVADGVVTAVNPGTCTITVTTDDGDFTANCAVTVSIKAINLTSPKVISDWSVASGSYYTSDTYLNIDGCTFKLLQCCKQTTLQFKASVGELTSPTINSANGFTVIIETAEGSNNSGKLTLQIGSEDAVTVTGPNKTVMARTTATSTSFTIKNLNSGIMKLGRITIIPYSDEVQVQTNGWATYIAPAAIEFAANTAYVVTDASVSTGLTLAPVTQVPAGTPVLLKGAGNKDITVIASASAPATNLLTVSNGTDLASGSYPYVLAKNGEGACFKQWTGAMSTLNGRVMLVLDEAASARAIFELDDETTAVNEVTTTNRTNNTNEFFDLQGRKVANPTKGLYIVNGKKVIIK